MSKSDLLAHQGEQMNLMEKETQVETDVYQLPLHENWHFRKASSAAWYDASVPGTNFTDMYQHNLIGDPFYRNNEAKLQWLENEDWEYRVIFNIDKEELECEAIELVFEGLDTYADVYLNGVLLFKADNMFVAWRQRCKNLLNPGDNELRVYFHSPINITLPKYNEAGFTYPAGNDKSAEKLSVYSRKAPYHFGWDWGPRFVTSGIWRPVYLCFYNHLIICDFHVIQHTVGHEKAEITAKIEVDSLKDQAVQLVLAYRSPDGVEYVSDERTFHLESSIDTLTMPVTIANPQLWWPHGMGEPHLYRIEVQVIKDGSCLAHRSVNVGLRTVEVVNEADKDGESFYLRVNGQPVFMKGANYIPSDSFLPRVKAAKYREIFENAKGSHMNMLRVWGGGIYEADVFYDLADAHGILIWQDFMFACSMYPGDKEFLENVRKEVVYNVKRLRNHPSIALWCGNNEVGVAWESWGWPEEYDYSEATCALLKEYYDDLFHELLPSVVKSLDPGRFYLPSSPISGWEDKEDLKIGNNHYWGVWHGQKSFDSYNYYVPRFMSEYGFQSFPDIESVKKYTLEEDWDLQSEVMLMHQKHPRGNELIKKYMQGEYRLPKDFEAFLYLSQILQAEGIKVAIEAHRRHRPFCMGTLYWQLNDCWPVASWSGIDYYGRWKALQYFVKQAYQDIITSMVQKEEAVEVFVVSDRQKVCDAHFTVMVLDFYGQKTYEMQEPIRVEANSSKPYFKTTIHQLVNKNNYKNHMLISRVVINDEVVTENKHYFTSPKNMLLGKPRIQVVVKECGEGLYVNLVTDVLAKNVMLSTPGIDSFFEDNYFDLVPRQPHTVRVHTDDPQKLKDALKIYSLFDSFFEQ